MNCSLCSLLLRLQALGADKLLERELNYWNSVERVELFLCCCHGQDFWFLSSFNCWVVTDDDGGFFVSVSTDWKFWLGRLVFWGDCWKYCWDVGFGSVSVCFTMLSSSFNCCCGDSK